MGQQALLGVRLGPQRLHRRTRHAEESEELVDVALRLLLVRRVGGRVLLGVGQETGDVVVGVGVEDPLEDAHVAQRGGTQRGRDEVRAEVALRVEVQDAEHALEVVGDLAQPLAVEVVADERQRRLRALRVGVSREGEEEGAGGDGEPEGDGEVVVQQVVLHGGLALLLTVPRSDYVIGRVAVVQNDAEGTCWERTISLESICGCVIAFKRIPD